MSVKYTRLVVDENVPKEVVESLKSMGFKEVYWIPEHKSGISDPEVWRIATEKGAVLVTGDIRFLPQLDQNDILYGPEIVEYSTTGFQKSELQDPAVMQFFIGWLFRNEHHKIKEHMKIKIEGSARSRRQLWQHEDARRRRIQ